MAKRGRTLGWVIAVVSIFVLYDLYQLAKRAIGAGRVELGQTGRS